MDYKNNQGEPNPVSTLIMGIVCSIILPPLLIYLKGGIPMKFGFILSPILIVFFICNFFREKKSNTKARKIKTDFTDGSYFDSAEWHEKYQKYAEKHDFEKIHSKGMKADLQRRYRKMTSVVMCLFGLFMIVGSCCIPVGYAGIEEIVIAVFGILIGIFIFYTLGFKSFLTLPVKKLYQENYDIAAVEDSYNNGKMMSHKKNGINIGDKYTVICSEKEIHVISNFSVHNVTHSITRVKKYVNSIYDSDEYRHRLCIMAEREYFVELNEYQVETAISELEKVCYINVTS